MTHVADRQRVAIFPVRTPAWPRLDMHHIQSHTYVRTQGRHMRLRRGSPWFILVLCSGWILWFALFCFCFRSLFSEQPLFSEFLFSCYHGRYSDGTIFFSSYDGTIGASNVATG